MIRLAAAAGLALGICAVAAWVALPRQEALPPRPAPSVVEVPLRPLVAAFPNGVADDEPRCPERERGSGSMPPVSLIPYSAITGAATPLEQELFPAAAPATSIRAEGGRIAVLRTVDDDEQQGRYDGRLVVFDGVTKQAICQAPVTVSSRGDLRWADVSPHALHRAHVEAVRQAVLEAGARLMVELRLPN